MARILKSVTEKPKAATRIPKSERRISKQELKVLLIKNNKRVFAVLLVILTFLFSFGDRVFSFVPTWDTLYKTLGIAPNSCSTLDFAPMPLTLTVLDVGQGECVFICVRDDKNEKEISVLYDTGEAGNEEKIISYLAAFDVRRLDYLILSHPHSDHIGSAPNSCSTLDFAPMPLTLTVLDVGQGECVFICVRDDKNEKEISVLYDTGEAGNEEKIISYLAAFDVRRLDYLILSHPHSDHIGSAAALVESDRVQVDDVIVPEISSEAYLSSANGSDLYEALLNTAKSCGAGVTEAEAGDKFSKGELGLMVLAPTCQRERLNNMSLVVRVTYGETSFLLMGDAESEEEYDLLRTCTPAVLSADVLVVGHHGSETSSTYDFLSSVLPSYAIISCGADNKYGHPHAVTLNTLEDVGARVYRTDLKGNVVIGSDGKKTIALR